MFSNIRKKTARNLINIPGWRTDRKIVVFESDDWGAVRMPSKRALSEIANYGIDVQKCHYVQHDALASEEDLIRLFDLLNSFRDSRGKNPVITANTIMTNPDFNKIRDHNFEEYHYELFTETLERYPNHAGSFGLWKQGMQDGLFHPQFHGREHLQVIRWMNHLKKTGSDTRKAFNAGVFGLSTTVTSENRRSYMACYDWDGPDSRDYILSSIVEGLSLFKKLFGYESLSSIAPNYVWHKEVERVMGNHGVRYLQGGTVQKSPRIGKADFQCIRHYTGQKNEIGQVYLVRNCKFEPSSNPESDWVKNCMNDIETAFFWKKPAIIETHRVNYIGFIQPENRDRNLKLFNKLLSNIIRKWPAVEFLTSEQLGNMIENDE